MPSLRLHLLGGFQVSADGEALTVNAPRLQSLIAYLAIHRGTAHTRQQLAYVLWPDSAEAQARTNLRKLLLQLRESWPDVAEVTGAEAQVLQWRADAAAYLDVAEFEVAVARSEWERATSIYAGDLLPECYDEWATPERERLRQLFTNATVKLIAALESRRDYHGAIMQAQRLLQHDPLDEATYRTLMRLHALSGDRASALRTFQTCQQTMRREFGLEPDDETSALAARLSQGDGPAQKQAEAASQPIPLVGRFSEWQRLLKAWERTVNASAPQCVIIAGEAGIGKTRLAEELASWAGRQGIITASARCYAAEGTLAYAPVTAWLRASAIRAPMARLDGVWLTEAARLMPELLTEIPSLPAPSPLTQGWHRQRLFESLARAVLSGKEPLLLLLDDAQWSDQDTLEWLRFLLRFEPHARLMLVATVRSEEVGGDHPLRAFQEQVQREGHLTEIELDPLNATETAALATQVSGQAPPPDHLAHLYRETEGNPLFVVETMRFQSSNAPNKAEREPVPSSIQAVIAHRLNQLTPDARDVTGCAATIGRAFTLDVLAQASERSHAALVRDVDELLHRRIIREQGSGYDFSHDKIREAAYRSLSAARRQLLHRRVATALEQIHADDLDAVSGQIAAHYELAGLPKQAVEHYQQAAQAARDIYANADAIRYYQRAQRLLDEVSNQRPFLASLSQSLNESLGDVFHHVTQHANALAAYRRALASTATASQRDLARLHRKLGNVLRDQREYREALLAYAAAEGCLSDPTSADADADARHEWIQVRLEVDSLYYWQGRVADSGELLQQLQPILERYGTPSQRAEFFRSLALRIFSQNHGITTDEAVAYAQASLDAFAETGDQAHIPAAKFALGFVLLWHSEPEQAEQPVLDALRMAERTGDASLVARCVTYLTIVYRQLGQEDQVQEFIARSLAAAAAANMPEYTAQAQANTSWVAWRNGDWDGVHEHGHTATTLWGQLPAGHASAPIQWTALLPLLAAALHADDTAQAVDHAKTLLRPDLQRLPDALTTALDQAIQAWYDRQPNSARTLLDQSIALAQQFRLL